MTTPAPRELTVALLGGGTVGSQVARLLRESADDLSARAGAPLRLIGIGVRGFLGRLSIDTPLVEREELRAVPRLSVFLVRRGQT